MMNSDSPSSRNTADSNESNSTVAELLESARRKAGIYSASLQEARLSEMSSLKRLEDERRLFAMTVEAQAVHSHELERELVHTIDAMRGGGGGDLHLGPNYEGLPASLSAIHGRGLSPSSMQYPQNSNNNIGAGGGISDGNSLPYSSGLAASSQSPMLFSYSNRMPTTSSGGHNSDLINSVHTMQEENRRLAKELSLKNSECESLMQQLASSSSINRQLNSIKDQLSSALSDSNGKLQFRQNQILDYEKEKEAANRNIADSSRSIDSLQNQIKLHKNELAISHAELRQAASRVHTLEKEITELHGYGLDRERHQKITEGAKLEAADTRHRELSRSIESLTSQLQEVTDSSNSEKSALERRIKELENENLLLIGELKGAKIDSKNILSQLEACRAQGAASAGIIKDLESINKLLLEKKLSSAPIDAVESVVTGASINNNSANAIDQILPLSDLHMKNNISNDGNNCKSSSSRIPSSSSSGNSGNINASSTRRLPISTPNTLQKLAQSSSFKKAAASEKGENLLSSTSAAETKITARGGGGGGALLSSTSPNIAAFKLHDPDSCLQTSISATTAVPANVSSDTSGGGNIAKADQGRVERGEAKISSTSSRVAGNPASLSKSAKVALPIVKKDKADPANSYSKKMKETGVDNNKNSKISTRDAASSNDILDILERDSSVGCGGFDSGGSVVREDTCNSTAISVVVEDDDDQPPKSLSGTRRVEDVFPGSSDSYNKGKIAKDLTDSIESIGSRKSIPSDIRRNKIALASRAVTATSSSCVSIVPSTSNAKLHTATANIKQSTTTASASAKKGLENRNNKKASTHLVPVTVMTGSTRSRSDPSTFLAVSTSTSIDLRGDEESSSSEPSTPKIVVNMTIPSPIVPFGSPDISDRVTDRMMNSERIRGDSLLGVSDCDTSVYSLGNLSDTIPYSAREHSSSSSSSSYRYQDNNNNSSSSGSNNNSNSKPNYAANLAAYSKRSASVSGSAGTNIGSKAGSSRPVSAPSKGPSKFKDKGNYGKSNGASVKALGKKVGGAVSSSVELKKLK